MLKKMLTGLLLGLLLLSSGCAWQPQPPVKEPEINAKDAQQPQLETPKPQSKPEAPKTPSAQLPKPKPRPKPATTAPSTPKAVVTAPLPPKPQYGITEAEIAQVERMVLDLVNQDRRKNGLSPVVWDETAAKAARRHVKEEADYGYISHWGLDGVKPQQRYTKAGGLDAVDENESVTLWQDGRFLGIAKGDLYKVVAKHENLMLNEQPPDDGHRKNILDPHHTGLGIAIAVGKYGVAMAQEFTNHYAALNPVPLTAAAGSKVTLSGKIEAGYQISGIYALWEGLPRPMTKEQLMKTHSYSDPPWDNLHFWAKPGGQSYYITTAKGKIFGHNVAVDGQGNFTLSVPLDPSAALDYITLELAPKDNPNDTFYAGQFVVRH